MVFAFAFLIRLPGIGWGLPNSLHNQSYHPDEQVIFSFSQQIDVGHGKFLPGDYHYGSLYLLLLSVASKVVAGYGGGPGNTLASIWAFIGTVDLAGRIISAIAGAGTALVLFLLLRRWTNVLGSIAGALCMALAPAFLVHSRFQTVDVLATFLLALSLYYSTLLVPSEKDAASRFLRCAILAGVFAGLSAGTKYTGILAVLSLLVACWLSHSPKKVRAALLGCLAAMIAFLISTPGVLFDSRNFLRDFQYEMMHTSTGHDLLFVDVGSGFLYHIVNLAAGITPVLLLLGVIGVGFALAKKQGWMYALCAFFFVYYILIGRAEVLFLRYTFPLYIALAAGFGWWMGEAHRRAGRHRSIVALGIIGLGLAAMAAMHYTLWMTGADPRDLTALVLRDQAKQKPNTAVGLVSDPWYYTPPLIPDSASMRGYWVLPPRRLVEEVQLEEMAASKDPSVVQAIPATGIQDRFDWDSRLVTDMKPNYIVYSSFEQNDLERLQNERNLDPTAQLRVNRYKDFQAKLITAYRPDFWELPDFVVIPDLEYIHPYIYLWKRKDLP